MPILKTVTTARGHTISTLAQKFPIDISDEDWMTELGNEGDWIAITKNPRICTIPQERAKWLESRVTTFFLDGPGWGNLKLWDFSWRLIRWWPIIVEVGEKAKAGTGYIVPATHSARFRLVAVKRSEMKFVEDAANAARELASVS